MTDLGQGFEVAPISLWSGEGANSDLIRQDLISPTFVSLHVHLILLLSEPFSLS